MPIVPHNTITKPHIDRLSELRMARPHGAEAMDGPLAQLGRAAGIAEKMADATGRKYDLLLHDQRVSAAKRNAAAEGLLRLGGQVVQTSQNIDRLQQKRAIEEAEEPLALFESDFTKGTKGYIDPNTNEFVPGTFNVAYTPARGDKKAYGASVATAEWLKEWDKNEKSHQNLSPRARAYFDKRVQSLIAPMMTQATSIDEGNIKAYKEASRKHAEAASMEYVVGIGTTMTDVSEAVYGQTLQDAARANLMRTTPTLQRDPFNTDYDKAIWNDEALAQAIIEAFVTQTHGETVKNLLLKAGNAPDLAEREKYLARAERYLTYGDASTGKSLLPEQSIEGFKKAIADSRDKGKALYVEETRRLIQEAEDLQASVILGVTDDSEGKLVGLMYEVTTRSPAAALKLHQTLDAAVYGDEMSHFKQALAEFDLRQYSGEAGASLDELETWAKGFKSQQAKTAALTAIANIRKGEQSAFAQQVSQEAKDIAYFQASSGLKMLDDGSIAEISRPEQVQMIADFQAEGLIDPETTRKLRDDLRKQTPAKQALFREVVDYIGGAYVPKEDLHALFKYEDGRGVYAQKNKKLKTRLSWTNVPDDWDGQAKLKETRQKLKLEADLIAEMVEQAMAYELQEKPMSRDGSAPKTWKEFLDANFTPDKNKTVKKMDQDYIRRNMADREQETMELRHEFGRQLHPFNYGKAAP